MLRILSKDPICIQPEENGTDLFFGIKRFIDDYNYNGLRAAA
ncbi:MAG: hypothetical protein PUC61_01495 [Bacteroidales bacterium]|nr:hypothetical protein [Bacteroidales bacterium]